MENILIGRTPEREVLLKALHSRKPEMVAVIGRRRVGKTFLIHSVYKDNIAFQISGVQDGTLKEQLKNFTYLLKQTFGLKHNEHSLGLIDKALTMDVLFTEEE